MSGTGCIFFLSPVYQCRGRPSGTCRPKPCPLNPAYAPRPQDSAAAHSTARPREPCICKRRCPRPSCGAHATRCRQRRFCAAEPFTLGQRGASRATRTICGARCSARLCQNGRMNSATIGSVTPLKQQLHHSHVSVYESRASDVTRGANHISKT